MIKLLIVRHGQTDWNKKGLLQGVTDIELNEEGINQIKELSTKINYKNIDICFCSPLKRTRQTAQILTQNKLKVIYDEAIIERGFGKYEGKPINYDLLLKQWNYKLNDTSNNIESIQKCLLRAYKFIEKLNSHYKDKTILIVSHGSFIKALHYNLIGYDENTDFLSFHPQNSTVYEYVIN